MNRKLNPLTEEQISKYLKELNDNLGGEMGHVEADTLLCNILDDLGLMDIVDAYNRVPHKWYA